MLREFCGDCDIARDIEASAVGDGERYGAGAARGDGYVACAGVGGAVVERLAFGESGGIENFGKYGNCGKCGEYEGGQVRFHAVMALFLFVFATILYDRMRFGNSFLAKG